MAGKKGTPAEDKKGGKKTPKDAAKDPN